MVIIVGMRLQKRCNNGLYKKPTAGAIIVQHMFVQFLGNISTSPWSATVTYKDCTPTA